MGLSVKVKAGFELARLDLDRHLADHAIYMRRLEALQAAMLEIEQAYKVERRRGIILFEGWDAGGKGGAIERLTAGLDHRSVRVWPIGAPTPDERGQHYLARFWEKLPPPGQIAVFDRSWYGRVLVERVDGLIAKATWRRAYDEINAFEKMLIDDGICLVKLFLHVSRDEQVRRLRDRITEPLKRWKITGDDIRNLARRDDYLPAITDMFAQNSTRRAPWHAVAGDHKWFARVAVAHTVVKRLGKRPMLRPPVLDPDVARKAEELLDRDTARALGLPPAD